MLPFIPNVLPASCEGRNFEIVRTPQCRQRHPLRCSTCWIRSYPCHARGKFRSLNRFVTFFLCSGFLSPAQTSGGYLDIPRLVKIHLGARGFLELGRR